MRVCTIQTPKNGQFEIAIRVVTILGILFIQYHIIIGYNNVETWVQYSGAEFCHKTTYFK